MRISVDGIQTLAAWVCEPDGPLPTPFTRERERMIKKLVEDVLGELEFREPKTNASAPVPTCPDDELLLAIALQEASARHMGPAMGEYFTDGSGEICLRDDPACVYCCAVGALVLAGVVELIPTITITPAEFRRFDPDCIINGNDDSVSLWSEAPDDRGETMGHAYQLAMGGYGG